MGGFEPPTTCTPSRCATRLRYIPIRRRSNLFSIIPVEKSQYFPKLLADLLQRLLRRVAAARAPAVAAVASRRRRTRRRRPSGHLLLEPLLRAGDREALFVEKLLDAQHGLDVATPVDPLARGVLRGRQRRKLRLPVAQDVGLGVGDLAHLADLEEELVRDLPFHAGRPRRLIRRRRAEQLRGTEDDGAARLDEHLLSSLGIATASLPLLADHERAEACDLYLLAVSQAVLDGVEDDLHQPRRLPVRQAPMPLIDDARDVRLRHGATAPLCEVSKNECLQPLRLRNFEHYMSGVHRCQEETLPAPASMAATAHLEHDRRAAEAELPPQLVLQVALVREMEIHWMVDREHEGRRVDADLGCVEEL